MSGRNVQWTVDQALAKADGADGLIHQREALTLLAAEVRALRAAIGRVEALCTQLEENTKDPTVDPAIFKHSLKIQRAMAEAIRTVLRGKP